MSKRVKENIRIAIALITLFILLAAVGYIECHYTRKDCVVTEVRGQEVVVEDQRGYVWCYYAEDDVPRVGDVVDLLMHTAHTDTDITDDEVINVREH